MINDNYGVAALGPGWMGGMWILAVLQNPKTRLVAVYDSLGTNTDAVTNAKKLISEHWAKSGAKPEEPDYYDNLESVLNRKDVDLLVVSTVSSEHAKMTIDGLEAGKHVICEKPLGVTYYELMDMVKAAEAHPDLMTLEDLSIRFYEVPRYMHDLCTSGALGDIRNMTGTYAHDINTGAIPWDRLDSAIANNEGKLWKLLPEYAGGAIPMGIIHAIDFAIWINDKTTPKEVIAKSQGPYRKPYQYDPTWSITIYFENGSVAQITGDTESPHGYNFLTQVQGTQGTVTFNSMTDKPNDYNLYVSQGEDKRKITGLTAPVSGNVAHHKPYLALCEMIRSIETGEPSQLAIPNVPLITEKTIYAAHCSAAYMKRGEVKAVPIDRLEDHIHILDK